MSKNLPAIAKNDQTCSGETPDQVPAVEAKISNRIAYEFFNGECFHIMKGATNKEPLFKASQVAKVLGYADPDDAIQKHCKNIHKIADKSGPQGRWILIIGEPDLYRLIIRSKKPEAQEFERWVMEEVLPGLRRTGKYSRKLNPNEDGRAILDEAKAKHAEQMELFPDRLQLRFSEEPVCKLRETRARLAQAGTVFETHEDFIGYVIEKGLEAI